MDTTRPSTATSYVEQSDGRPSLEANQSLSAYQPTTAFPRRTRADSTTSSAANYSSQRLSQGSQEFLTNNMAGTAPKGSGGYNRSSFYPPTSEAPVKGGFDERPLNNAELGVNDDGWDVYADFNNTGPRYSSTLGTNSSGYQRLPPRASKPDTPMSESGGGPVELVTVPALGAEWKSSELRAMTKAAKREDRWDRWSTRWTSFRRDEHGFCGIRWMTRRLFVIILFVVCCVVGIILAFTVPRVPGFSFNINTPLNGSSHVSFIQTPGLKFSFDTNLNLQVDTNSNFLPLHFKRLHATIFDSDTEIQIGEGEVTGKTFKAKAFNDFLMPVTFSYVAINSTDITWNDVHKACQNTKVIPFGESRPPLKLRLVLDMDIAGLISHPTAGTSIDADCPFELPMNAS